MAEGTNDKTRMFRVDEARALDEFLKGKLKEPVPEPDTFPTRKLIRMLYPTLRELRDKGYTLQMLVNVLSEKGISINRSHLSAHMTAVARAQKSGGSGSPTGNGDGTHLQRSRETESTTARRSGGSFVMKPDSKL